ncbi:MAG: hypothetical protein ACXWMI_12755 [Syntrophales bacterium]
MTRHGRGAFETCAPAYAYGMNTDYWVIFLEDINRLMSEFHGRTYAGGA